LTALRLKCFNIVVPYSSEINCNALIATMKGPEEER